MSVPTATDGSIPSSSNADSVVGLTAILTGTVTCDRTFIVDPAESETIDMPVFAFLIQKEGKAYLFDIGLRPDLDVVPSDVSRDEYTAFVPKTLSTLPASLPKGMVVDTVFVSHYHWDHLGNPGLFPEGTNVAVGPGTLEAIGEGYPTGDPFISGEWLKHCNWSEVNMNSGPVGSFPRAKDWFGDGSLWLIDCPGHCKGHMIALARVSTSPDSYVLLGGDCCHDQEFLHGQGPTCPCSIAYYKTAGGEKVSLHEDHAVAYGSMERLRAMNSRPDVMVILSHEREAVEVIPCLQADGTGMGALKDWREKGWKEAKVN